MGDPPPIRGKEGAWSPGFGGAGFRGSPPPLAIKQRGELRLHEILLSGITMDYKESGLKKGGNSLKTRQETRREEQKPSGGNVGMGWDGMRWDAMGWGDGMGWDAMGWDGMRGCGAGVAPAANSTGKGCVCEEEEGEQGEEEEEGRAH